MANEELTIVQTDGSTETPIGDEKKPFDYDESAPNLVATFMGHEEGLAALDKIAEKVHGDYHEAWDSTEEYRERRQKDWLIFCGNLPKKEFPFKDAANAHVPILIENMARNVMRSYDELFGDWNDVFGVAALGPNDQAMAQVLTLHGNWQLRSQILDFKRQQFKGMLGFFMTGDIASHSYYDLATRRNRHEMLSVDEFVTPYTYTAMMPDYSDVPYRIKIVKMYPHELEARRASWENVDEMLKGPKPTFDSDPEQPNAEATARDQGIEPDEIVGAAPYKILWYEGWLELPNQSGRRFCRVMCDADKKTIFELSIHERADWQDVQRFESQQQELIDYQNQMQQFAQVLQQGEAQLSTLRQQQAYALDSGFPANPALSQELAQAEDMMRNFAPPLAPTWMKDPQDPEEKPKLPKKVPVHLFAHGVCIEPLFGNLGLGYGRIVADENRAANVALSQFVDAATLNNIWSMLVSDGLQFDGKDQLELAPGKVIRITGQTGEDLRKSIVELKPGAPNPQLIDVVKMMREFANGAMQSPDVLSGAPGKSGETFRGIAARIEQATKQLSVTTRKYGDFLEQILRNNAVLNSIYLDEEEFFHVALQSGSPYWQYAQGAPGEATPGPATPGQDQGKESMLGKFAIGRKMYERNYHVEVRADLRFASQSQKIHEADEILTMVAKIPYLAGNPLLQYMAARDALLARGKNELVQALGPPPPMPPPQVTTMPNAQGMTMPMGQPVPGQGPPPGQPPPQQGPPQQQPQMQRPPMQAPPQGPQGPMPNPAGPPGPPMQPMGHA